MSYRKYHFLLLFSIGLLLALGLIFMWPSDNVQAQCGSQASSCKNCHEVQAKDPVNSDGTGWHQSHAFGDFCYICHAGNNQSMDKATAHTGMVPPLSDIKAACQSCHPDDLTERAQVYASLLGIDLASGGTGAPSGGATPAAEASASTSEVSPEAAAPALVVESEDMIDYNQRYDEEVLGKRQINWGNLILTIMIAGVILGGGAFVFYNERKKRGLPLWQAKAKSASAAGEEAPVVEGYSPEVTELLPKIARLNPAGLHALKRLLENPESANQLLHNISKLDPELVNRVRSLDRASRELLLAMSGD